jgi:hypothetical protein
MAPEARPKKVCWSRGDFRHATNWSNVLAGNAWNDKLVTVTPHRQ